MHVLRTFSMLLILVVCPVLSVHGAPYGTPDTLQLDVSLASDSTGVFDTLRQSALLCMVTGTVWDSSEGPENPRSQLTYRWTLVSGKGADTVLVLDSITHLAAPLKHRLQLSPLEDADYRLFVSIPDTDFNRIKVYPDSIAFTVKTTDVMLTGNRWQMVSLARRPASAAAGTLFAGTDFWCSHWHEAAGSEDGNYVNYVSRSFESGYGYWVRPEGDAPVAMNLAGSAVDSSGTFRLPLLEGWNQVANPFCYAVAWDSVYYFNSSGSPLAIGPALSEDKPRGLFAWDVAAGSYVLRAPGDDNEVALMEPWQGYWVYADIAVTVFIPPAPYFSMLYPDVSVALKAAGPADSWQVTLGASGGDAADRCCILGARPGAVTGFGPEDIPKPAPMDADVTLNLADGLARDIRPAGGTHAWNIRLEASVSGPVLLEWDGTDGLPGGSSLYLQDAGTGTVIDMRRESAYAVPQNSASLTVMVSDDPAFDPAVLGRGFTVTGTGALPFTGSTELIFTVPAADADGDAVLTVYGADGGVIAGRTGAAAAGRIGWDGRDDAGAGVAAGAYPYVLTVGTARVTGLLLKAQ